jgi:hypothetical protein
LLYGLSLWAEKVSKPISSSGLVDGGYLLKTIDFVSQDDADIEDLVGWSMVRD